MQIKIDTVLKAMRVVPAIVAAAPEFKKLYDQLIASFSHSADQETLKKAYDLAISEANDADAQLRALIEERTGQPQG